jgi:hypothetical protein
MLIKTKEFVHRLNSRLYQYSFNRKIPLSLKGSFQNTSFISDIDFTSYVYFNDKFIEILINKIERLKDFKFIYLNAGIDHDFKIPWVIYPEHGCNVDIIKIKEWFVDFRLKNLIPLEEYEKIYDILYKDKLIIGDLIYIQDILQKYDTIKWFLQDIKKGVKVIRGHTYNLLEELKQDSGPVLNSLYIDNDDIVSVDIGLVDKRYKRQIWSRMYKYYTENWYGILKGYKKVISKDYEIEYNNVLSTLQYDNALMAQASLLKSILTYNIVDNKLINKLGTDLHNRLEKDNIKEKRLDDVVSIIKKKLNDTAKPYVDYFLDKLTHYGKIKIYMNLRLTELSKISTSTENLIKRKQDGIECPFFESDTYQQIDNISIRTMLNKNIFLKCMEKQKPADTLLSQFIKDIFYTSPVYRLFLQINKIEKVIYVRGAITHTDSIVLEKFGVRLNEQYICNIKYTKRLQIYLLTGY